MIKTGVIGATGYTGLELLRILSAHPGVEVCLATSDAEAGRSLAEVFPSLRSHTDLVLSAHDDPAASGCDLVFFATPNGKAMRRVPKLLDAGTRIIDLSADFRLSDADSWARWYGETHACPELLDTAVYGLPELNREAIKAARLIANPGCYPTAITLGLLPALQSGIIDGDDLIADAKSGVSGAGRKTSMVTQFSEAGESFTAYGVPGHRHHPEIVQTLERFAGGRIDLVFVPHLVPMSRGIHATLYATKLDTDASVQTLYENYYREEHFVDVLPPGSHPGTISVRGSNHCRIAVHEPGNGRRLVILSVIDNLVKGAAGQAVQNMNIMYGLDEVEGLTFPALVP